MPMDNLLYKKPNMSDVSFPIIISKAQHEKNMVTVINNHWHPQMEIILFLKGEAVFKCNSNTFSVKEGDLIVVNSNEIHYCQSLNCGVEYCWLVIDSSLLQSYSFDSCEVKYITPILQNHILFENKISNDTAINNCINNILKEYEIKQYGYELAIKSSLFNLLMLMLRSYIKKTLNAAEYEKRGKDLEKLHKALEYIGDNYLFDITTIQLARLVNFNEFYFSNLFKKTTGMTVKEYTNHLRINKAENLLKNTDMNVTEIALNTGFNDINYFSRIFKKYKQVSPTSYKKTFSD